MVSSVQVQEPVSRTDQYKKVMKPLLERKRRARINKCLDELRDLLVAALQAEGETVTRLEKADILELTVRHVRRLNQRRRLTIPTTQPNQDPRHDVLKFQQGFVAAAQQVQNFLVSTSSLEANTSSRLLNHLTSCASTMMGPPTPPPQPAVAPPVIASAPPSIPSVPTSSQLSYPPQCNSSQIQSPSPFMTPKSSPPLSPPPLIDLRVKQEPHYSHPAPVHSIHPAPQVLAPTPLREPISVPQDLSMRRPEPKEHSNNDIHNPRPVERVPHQPNRYQDPRAPLAPPRQLPPYDHKETADAWRPW